MTESGRKLLFVWSMLLGLLMLILIFQTALWPEVFRFHGITAQFSLPILLHFSLYASPAFALSLFYGFSILSTAFMVTPFINIFAAYILLYVSTLFSCNFYHWKEFKFFFVVCGIWAILFPLILDTLSHFSTQPHFAAPPLHLILMTAFLTSLLGALLYPLLKQFHPPPRS